MKNQQHPLSAAGVGPTSSSDNTTMRSTRRGLRPRHDRGRSGNGQTGLAVTVLFTTLMIFMGLRVSSVGAVALRDRRSSSLWKITPSLSITSRLRIHPLQHDDRTISQSQRQYLHGENNNSYKKVSRRDQGTTVSVPSSDSLPWTRVKVFPFRIRLTPCPYRLGESELDDLHRQLTAALYSRFAAERTKLDPSVSVKYILLGKTDGLYNNSHTTLVANGGIVAFVGPSTVLPSTLVVNGWVRTAIENDLLPALQSSTQFSYIEQIVFLSDYDPGTATNPPLVLDTNAATSSQSTSNNQESDSNILGIAIGAVGGGLTLFALLALLVVRRRKKQHVAIQDEQLYLEHQSDKSRGSRAIHSNDVPESAVGRVNDRMLRNGTYDSKSVADSESEWTMNTEAGDTSALKSLGRMLTVQDAQPMTAPESFERDRRVMIRKDMLTSAWIEQTSGAARGLQSESVLEPSHFSATSEQRERGTKTTTISGGSPIMWSCAEDNTIDDHPSAQNGGFMAWNCAVPSSQETKSHTGDDGDYEDEEQSSSNTNKGATRRGNHVDLLVPPSQTLMRSRGSTNANIV